MSDNIKASWVNALFTGLGVAALAFGGYGHFSAALANKEARIVVLEKEHLVSTKERGGLDNELDVLWADTRQNTNSIERNSKEIEKSNRALEKFSDAVDRLIISVTRLEEKLKYNKDSEIK